jgi:hypothetical protein
MAVAEEDAGDEEEEEEVAAKTATAVTLPPLSRHPPRTNLSKATPRT